MTSELPARHSAVHHKIWTSNKKLKKPLHVFTTLNTLKLKLADLHTYKPAATPSPHMAGKLQHVSNKTFVS